MLAKMEERNRAVELRKLGFSYREILAEVPVAKSTLSIWLCDVGLAKKQVQRITGKKVESALKGALKRKQQRLKEIQEHLLSGKEKVGLLTERDVFIIGSVLYWAEGSKQKEHNVSQQVCFDNMDVRMVKIFLCWLDTICHVKTDSVKFQLFIHTTGNTKRLDS